MKTVINFLLAIFAPLAAVPTGWAIYAGLTEKPAFPMWEPAAMIGAIAVVATTVAASLLVVDILKHNQEAQDENEKTMNLPIWYGWVILAGCISAEILLTLLIVVIPGLLPYGVLAFPLVTLAGAFSFALRLGLRERVQERATIRAREQAKVEQEAIELKARQEQEKAERKAQRLARKAEKVAAQEAGKAEQVAPQVARKTVPDDELLAYLASNPGESHKQVAAHFGVSRQAIGQRVKKLYEVKQ